MLTSGKSEPEGHTPMRRSGCRIGVQAKHELERGQVMRFKGTRAGFAAHAPAVYSPVASGPHRGRPFTYGVLTHTLWAGQCEMQSVRGTPKGPPS